jgi:hypothetical protein
MRRENLRAVNPNYDEIPGSTSKDNNLRTPSIVMMVAVNNGNLIAEFGEGSESVVVAVFRCRLS